MGFPETRLTLVQRLASGDREEDWRVFLRDYWGPVYRFALRRGARSLDDAEDVASQTFEVLWEGRLLGRWVSNRSAKLRTLLCSVVRNILSNRNRVRAGRERLWRDVAEHVEALSQTRSEEVDAFYAAWVEDVIGQAVESLAAEYYRKNQGDYIRVLYGRLCEQLTIAEVAEALEIKPSAVDYYFRHSRQRLQEKLREVIRPQVQRYCTPAEAEQEFTLEWEQLGRYLTQYGGLEEAVRRTYDTLDPVQAKSRRHAGLTKAVTRLTSIMRPVSDANASGEET